MRGIIPAFETKDDASSDKEVVIGRPKIRLYNVGEEPFFEFDATRYAKERATKIRE